jgi:4-hydroxybenzoate polyprenyltransferase
MSLLSDYILLTRLNRPIGIWLLLFPGFAGLSSADTTVPYLYWVLFLVGAIVMRSAGCIYNDIIDRPFDGRVDRTKHRPLVRVHSPMSLPQAFGFLMLNLLIGLVCLLHFNTSTIVLGVGTAALIAIYPWMKRLTYWPQLFLGFTMNMGFLMGVFALRGTITFGHLLMYLGMVAWTLGYDTIYGFQDMEDDAMIGVKSSTLKLKTRPRLFITLIYLAALSMWSVSGAFLRQTLSFYTILGIIILIFAWQALTLNFQDPANCLRRFKSNKWVAAALWLALAL